MTDSLIFAYSALGFISIGLTIYFFELLAAIRKELRMIRKILRDGEDSG